MLNGHFALVHCQLMLASSRFSTTRSIVWLTKQPTVLPTVQSWSDTVRTSTWSENSNATSQTATLYIQFCHRDMLTSSRNPCGKDFSMPSNCWSCCSLDLSHCFSHCSPIRHLCPIAMSPTWMTRGFQGTLLSLKQIILGSGVLCSVNFYCDVALIKIENHT